MPDTNSPGEPHGSVLQPETPSGPQAGATDAASVEPLTEQDYLQHIQAQQKRVAEQLRPLEERRSWWRKYI